MTLRKFGMGEVLGVDDEPHPTPVTAQRDPEWTSADDRDLAEESRLEE